MHGDLLRDRLTTWIKCFIHGHMWRYGIFDEYDSSYVQVRRVCVRCARGKSPQHDDETARELWESGMGDVAWRRRVEKHLMTEEMREKTAKYMAELVREERE